MENLCNTCIYDNGSLCNAEICEVEQSNDFIINCENYSKIPPKVEIVEMLHRKVKEFMYYHNESPNVIYIGRKEWYELMSETESLQYMNETEEENKFMGIPLIEVGKENYLKVGIVE